MIDPRALTAARHQALERIAACVREDPLFSPLTELSLETEGTAGSSIPRSTIRPMLIDSPGGIRNRLPRRSGSGWAIRIRFASTRARSPLRSTTR